MAAVFEEGASAVKKRPRVRPHDEYQWDQQNRLVKALIGSHESDDDYDGASRRWRITEKESGTQAKQETFVWCGGAICQKRSGSTVERSYFAGGFQESGSTNYFYTRDHLGSTREVVGERRLGRIKFLAGGPAAADAHNFAANMMHEYDLFGYLPFREYQMSVYILRAAAPPWGDYGRVLIHGISSRLARVDGTIQLERTGPFVPPISFPTVGEIVVTSPFREALDASGLSGLSFQHVAIVTAVRLRWGTWDRTERLPSVVPPSGEPEDYVQPAQHDPECAGEIGKLWEIRAPIWGVGNRTTLGFRKYSYNVDVRPNCPDFFRVEGLGFIFVSGHARDWLAEAARDLVSFEAVTHN